MVSVRTTKGLRAGAAFAAALGMAVLAPPAVQADEPADDQWGVPHETLDAQKVVVGSASTVQMPDGEWRTWAVLNQSPDALLVEIDPFAGEVLSSYPMPGVIGSWGTEVAPDGTVWSASHTAGRLYSLEYGATEVTRTERPMPGTSFIWELDVGADGNVYGGTFEGWTPEQPAPAYAFGYDPQAQEFQSYGPFEDADTYIRSTETVGDELYVGTGSTDPHLYRVDTASGAFESVPFPESLGTCQFVYGLEEVGTDLYVRFNNCGELKNVGYVYDTVAQEWREHVIPNYYGTVSQPTDDGDVYLVADHVLHRFDPVTGELEARDIGRLFVNKFLTIAPDPVTGDDTVIGLSVNGDMGQLNLETGESKYFVPEGMTGELGESVRASGMSPDGRYHVSVGFGGGLGIYDPAASAWEWFPELGQGESFAFLDGKAYIGVYPSARVYEYDPTQEWSETNARQVVDLRIEGQDRPFGLVAVEDKLAVGSVAGYGLRQGALTLVDPTDGSYTAYQPVEEHGVISLTYRDGVIYGGTTIYGGNGSTPIDDDGRVFAWDVEAEELLWETVAIAGEKGVGSLTFGDDGRLFGATVGHVFEIDPETGEVLREGEIDPVESTALRGRWHISDLSYDPSDEHLYLSTSSSVYRIEVETFADVTPEPTTGSKLRVAPDGTKYWVVGRTIYSGVVEEDVVTDPATAMVSLEESLQDHTASGAVAGPIAHQLAKALDQAQKHLDGDRVGPAVGAMERFVRHVDNPKLPDTLDADAAEDLRGQAVTILDLLEEVNDSAA
ncbi:FIMAH domain-containing protein [Georgenia subflava]|uniref:FIMAH domain-containing protein n=1 Tax=Georgenia subflava TaxID=1622177 RepID=A0A6N7EBW6_9MICO|nr:hypothetical protein [Georgenia subflava]MPV35609.1 hypothetical protein [Georgenia subflava]